MKTQKEEKIAKSPQTQKEVEDYNARRAGMSPEAKLKEDTAGVRSYDGKVSDYKEHFNETLGMSDPGTEARIQAMETAHDRVDRSSDKREPELVARDEAREAHAETLQSGTTGTTGKFGQIPNERKAANIALSEEMTDRKEHDEDQQDLQEKGMITNITRGGSEEAETGIDNPKKAKAAIAAKNK